MANIPFPPQYHHPYLPVRRHSSSPNPNSVFLKPSSFKHIKLSSSLNSSDSEASQPSNEVSSEIKPDPVKLAFEKAQKYKKAKQSNPEQKSSSSHQNSFQLSNGKSDGSGGSSSSPNTGDKEVPLSVKLAVERAKEYKKDRGVAAGTIGSDVKTTELKEGNGGSTGNGNVEKKVSKGPTISSIDFVGLNFADKKEGRALPAGLMPVVDPFTEGDFPEVEFIAGDTSKFTDAAVSATEERQEGDSELYKPKVSTWGVFPRPNNISKTFGGGKIIRPGEILETAEEKAAKQAKTRQLIEAYNTKIGLNIDPKLKSECEKNHIPSVEDTTRPNVIAIRFFYRKLLTALKDGDSLMDSGNLKEALPYYEIVMNKLVFQTKLHGLAALQWSICQDSLSRGKEAKSMYERLQSHPNPQVSKRARQFVFSFEAMEMMKVSSSCGEMSSMNKREYQEYFDAFVKDEASSYGVGGIGGEENEEGGVLWQALPYMLFLASPILIVIVMAVVQKGLVVVVQD